MPHPFDQLTPLEAKKSLDIIRHATGNQPLHIKAIQTDEPPKEIMIKYLEAEHSGKPVAPPPRIAYCLYFVLNERRGEQAWINLDTGRVIKKEDVPVNSHLPIDIYEGEKLEKVMLKHPDIIAALRKCGITEDLMVCVSADPWVYGADKDEPQPRYVMFLMYMRDPKTKDPESNIYWLPLPFVPVMDAMAGELSRIDWVATGNEADDTTEINYGTRSGNENVVKNFEALEYMPNLRDDTPRTDLKPYNVIQPEGPSFTVDGSLVKWQKWSFRVMMNPREGLVLGDIRYDGRQIFYRLSLSEMTVPYGDPRPPLNRKQAFDIGDYYALNSANTLGLGCDCLGVIKYFDGTLVNGDGTVEVRKNAVCMHEQDDGIQFKHTNFRTNVGRVARRRILVLQTVLTVANYEYIFAWHFDQAAGLEFEIRATGIISTQYIDPGKKSRWGTVVGKSVLAGHHQHIFSLRVDPAIDGYKNSIEVNEIKLDRRDALNPSGNGFYNAKSIVEKSSAFDANQAVNRYVRIINENKINPITMDPIGYKVMANPSPLLMAPEGTICRNRALFATHHFWVSKYRDGELYAGGTWTNQSSREIGGCADAVARNENVRNEDVVLWHSYGITHTPRIEDANIMNQERLTVGFMPHGFFTENPAMDVPSSNQEFNRSVEVKDCRACQRL